MARAAAARLELDQRLLKQCVHCGLCLDACPTYRLLGVEMDSPRGRIYQVRQVQEGRIALDDPNFRAHIYACLDCRACETACPSGVQYGRIVEAARAAAPPLDPVERTLGRAILNGVFTSKPLLSLGGVGLRLYQRSGLSRALRATHLLPPRLAELEALLPSAQGGILRGRIPDLTPALGPRRRRVGFLSGCVMDELMHQTNEATVRVLARNGCEVVTPPQQRCCGALHLHTGARETARALARHNIEAFEQAGVEAVVANAAGCGSTLKEYGDLLAGDPECAERARAFSRSARDVSEFLAEHGLDTSSMGEVRARVTYQDPCHLAHGQGIRTQPRQLLRAIPGLELVELRESEVCCGSAGTYNLTHPELSRQILDWKLDHLAATGARIVVASNPGCAFQLTAGLRRRGLELEVLHLVDLLERAYRAGEDGTRGRGDAGTWGEGPRASAV
ncbi:MAG: 4Fe-4S dicluster domain-containing protein [Chloroflexi bacterium]|nr:4Fe-4S dicluster domain-containing protein [Chloroflexota bacterium]